MIIVYLPPWAAARRLLSMRGSWACGPPTGEDDWKTPTIDNRTRWISPGGASTLAKVKREAIGLPISEGGEIDYQSAIRKGVPSMFGKKLGGSGSPMSPFYFNAVMLWHGSFLKWKMKNEK